jgi:hypothetical protein
VLLAASERWGVVSVVCLAYWFALSVFAPPALLGAGTGADAASLLFLLPVIVFWGAVSLAQVVAAIEPVKTSFMLPLLALGKGIAVGLRWVNIGRLCLLSAIIVLPMVGTSVLAAVFAQHHVHDAEFWANVPLDALTVGPIQALSTVFYVDFLRRARG